jgi:hypothetical protein
MNDKLEEARVLTNCNRMDNHNYASLSHGSKSTELATERAPNSSRIPLPPFSKGGSYKDKRHLLKRKVLLLKNATIEIGLISKPSKEYLECSLFCTAFSNLKDIALRLDCPPWLNVY